MRFVAALLCLSLIGYLMARDLRRPGRDPISWMPFCWMFIAGSRFVSHWLRLSASGSVVDMYSEGSAIDRNIFLALIVWGAVVLSRRDLNWGRLLTRNAWITAYLIYCLASVIWTNEPGILARRWLKDLGNPIVALVLLTERRPYEALVSTLRRLAFVWLPLSILFIRYFPEYGRAYGVSGGMMFTGVADQKNTLGLSCLLVGIAMVWTFVRSRSRLDRVDVLIALLSLFLLIQSNSKTSLACFAVAAAILLYGLRLSSPTQPTRIVTATACAAFMYLAADEVFGVKEYFLNALSRDASLTNRTDVWAVVRAFSTDPLLGAGFMSFWTGERMQAIAARIGSIMNQAHNGYLEQYLNLGYIGVAFVVGIGLVALKNIRQQLRTDYPVGVLRLCLVVVAFLYNYTEASFYGINNMWVVLLLVSIEPGSHGRSRVSAVATAPARFPRRLAAGQGRRSRHGLGALRTFSAVAPHRADVARSY